MQNAQAQSSVARTGAAGGSRNDADLRPTSGDGMKGSPQQAWVKQRLPIFGHVTPLGGPDDKCRHWVPARCRLVPLEARLRLAAMRPAVTHANKDSASRAIAPKNSVVDVRAIAIDRNLRSTRQCAFANGISAELP